METPKGIMAQQEPKPKRPKMVKKQKPKTESSSTEKPAASKDAT
jgi:hypothetical protein